MSALAGFMAARGHDVAGSDRAFDSGPSHPLYAPLKAMGIKVVPQDGSGLDAGFDLAVFSTAVEPQRPEAVRARELGIPVRTRPEFLAEIAGEHETIAVAGTSGKSTASGMLAFLMARLGMAPNFLGGGRVKALISEANPGNFLAGDSGSLVMEACESDGSIVRYRPLHSVILNLAHDHHPVEHTAGLFSALAGNTRGQVFLNADDPGLAGLGLDSAVAFSIDSESPYAAKAAVYHPLSTSFSVRGTRFHLSVPGRHNLYNALSAIAVLSELGAPIAELARLLPEFTGVQRRFDVALDAGGRFVVDDYAHNPHKIAALMETVARIAPRACYVFQPHGFGPTRMMKDGYISAFREGLRRGDHLMVLPVFYAGGTADRDISSADIADGVRAGGKSAEAVPDREAVLDAASEWDAWAVFGARDESLSALAGTIAARLRRG
ncbi:MAG: UDP-N-acetylmuramate--L-alanine ligase [Thermodesulfovibrionales bacterium]